MDPKDDTPLVSASNRPTRKRKQSKTHRGQDGSKNGRKRGILVRQEGQPSLTWLLPGAARAQRRPLPRPTKPPPPGITPQRRIGVWRRVREGGDTGTAVFVTLEGEIATKPHSYHAAQRDEAILAAAGIRGRGKGSRIEVPESVPPSLYPWQAQCLHLALPRKRQAANTEGAVPWRSLVYCAPTSGGKSLVAEVLISRRLLFEGVRSLVVVPHVSLCAEKVQHLRQLLGPLTLRIEAFHAGARTPLLLSCVVELIDAASNWYAGIDVAVCTLEKANMIINRLVLDLLVPEAATAEDAEAIPEPPIKCELPENGCDLGTLDESYSWASEWWDSVCRRMPAVGEHFPVGLVCVDELHFVGDPQRGHLLEMLLAKLLFLNRSLKRPIQLVGMSATLPNAPQVAKWLDAELFVTEERPSPLDIFVKVGPEVFSWDKAAGLQLSRKLHDGSLSLPPVGEAATNAAARAVRLAASQYAAVATGPLLATAQVTANANMAADHASIAAGALRFIREQADASAQTPSLTRDGVGAESAGEPKGAVTEGIRCGWQTDAEHLGMLTWEMLREGRRVIIFCPTQEWTARTASFLAKVLPFYRRAEAWADLVRQRAALCLKKKTLECAGSPLLHRQAPKGASDVQQDRVNCLLQQQKQAQREAMKELLAMPVSMLAQLLVRSPHLFVEPQNIRGREELQWQLKELSLINSETMLAAVREGVAYHHAGLTGEERALLEAGYRRGHLNVLCATSTLALGVNLPAARVIIRAPHFGRDELLSPGRFHQMAGRAGRKGLEHRGDAYLICSPANLPHVRNLLMAVAAADPSGSGGSHSSPGDTETSSHLRGQHLCRFFLEAVHVLLPLLRNSRETSCRLRSSAFVDVVAIMLYCTLRGRQDPHRMIVEEAAEAARYLHAYYLIEAEPSDTSPTLQSDGQTLANGSSGSSAFSQGPALGVAAGVTTRSKLASGSGQSISAVTVAPGERKHILRSLAFPSSCLPATCKLLLQQYPCLRSPVVLARLLQRCDVSKIPTERLPDDAFGSSVCLHFRGLKELAAQLSSGGDPVAGLKMNEPDGKGMNWRDIGGRLAVTEVGGAAVEAGITPWEAAEIFADVFKTSVLGLCADMELHLIFLAAVAVGGEMQPHWQSYLSIYDKLDPACRRVADALGIRRLVISREAIKAQGAPRRCINDTADLLLFDHLTFTQLQARVELETHRRFFFALLLHDVYREGEAYETAMRRFGISRSTLMACATQGALIAATVASFLRVLRPQEAALSEVCFVLAGKLKLTCSPVGALASALTDSSRRCKDNHEATNSEEGSPSALQQLLQLEGMTPGRAAALRAAHIYTCAHIANTPLYDLYKALEAAEPADLAPAELVAQGDQVSGSKIRRQRARLFAVSVKLKDSAQKEQEMRLQALEDEAAGHWSLVGKVTDNSGDEGDSVTVSIHS
ncbi:DNA polymerase theta, putative [Eimeria mitis]|uniref:DNA polymerase theta, putative n=1 Tax=Eimeria mitis TaxID=44415 RepID=U6JS36_9EIME|nr:DNA polymerase theta, putative [Eimeria mitis]CDJ26857.1 DNA polymerase theta, putative [Eimeria mitis]